MKRVFKRRIGKYGLATVLLLSLLVILVPLLLRVHNGAPITPGEKSYMLLRHSELLSSGTSYDPLTNEYLVPNPSTLLLSIMQFFGVPWLLPILLTQVFLILTYFYLSKIIKRKILVIISLAVLAVSPTMSFLGTSHSNALLTIIFVAAALLSGPVLSSVFSALAIITSPILGMLVAIYFTIRFILKREKQKLTGIILAIIVAGAWFVMWSNVPELYILHSDLLGVFFELGSPGGISVFFIILAFNGAISSILRNKQAVIFQVVLLFILTLFIPEMVPITVVVLSVLVGYSILGILSHKWNLELLQQSLFVLIFCLGLFLVIVSVKERISENPTAEFAHAMIELGNQKREGNVLSSPSYAPIIEYFSGRQATLSDSVSEETLQKVFYSRDVETFYEFLEKTNTSYIFITDDMQDSMFERSDQGILFLLPNTERFIAVSETPGGILWFYIRR